MTEADIHAMFADIAPVTVRRMFGGLGVYSEGVMFALAAGGELFLKADEDSAPAFGEAGSTPFVYQGRGGRSVALSYWRLPAAAYDDADELAGYAALALSAARRAAAAKPPHRARRAVRPAGRR